jgi:AraC-like DNA-binding protein
VKSSLPVEKVQVRSFPASGVTVVTGQRLAHHFPAHVHQSMSVGLVLSGKRWLDSHGHVLEVGAGEVFAILPGELHQCWTEENAAHDYQILCLNWPRAGYPAAVEWRSLPTGRLALLNDAGVRAGLLACFAALEGGESVLAGEAVERLLAGLWQTYLAPSGHAVSEEIKRLQHWLAENCAEQVSGGALGKQAALSQFYLNRRFHHEVGLAPHAYQIQARIRQAQDRLAAGQSVLETAHALGFTDQSHFTRFFKRYVGLTPASYMTINRSVKK